MTGRAAVRPWPRPAPSRTGPPGARRDTAILALVGLGIVLRVATYAVLNPANDDDHIGVIVSFLATNRFPAVEAVPHAYQPPLYYLLAIPWSLGGWKVTQGLSLLLSLGTLWALWALLRDPALIPDRRARVLAVALAACLPCLVYFGSHVSNDPLAFLIGAVVPLQARRYLATRSRRELIGLALVLGLGLLTKHTFVAFAPVLLALVAWVEWPAGARRTIVALGVFAIVAGALGGYKFAESCARYGRPLVTALDIAPPALLAQRTIRGIRPFLDVNVLTLVRGPVVSGTTSRSPWLLLYLTFWRPVPHLASGRTPGEPTGLLLGRATVLLALGATGAALVGLLAAVRDGLVAAGGGRPNADDARLVRAVCVALFVANVSLVVAAGARSAVWSVFEGRHLLPSLAGFLVMLGLGLTRLARWRRPVGRAVETTLVLLLGVFLFTYVLEALVPGL